MIRIRSDESLFIVSKETIQKYPESDLYKIINSNFRQRLQLIFDNILKDFDIISINSNNFAEISVFGNYVLPAKTGELVRAYVLGKRENISKSGQVLTANFVVSMFRDPSGHVALQVPPS